jgi:hypothetical protein
MLTTDILAAARLGREFVRALCHPLTDSDIRAEIEAVVLAENDAFGGLELQRIRNARAALETERDRRTIEQRSPPELRDLDRSAP